MSEKLCANAKPPKSKSTQPKAKPVRQRWKRVKVGAKEPTLRTMLDFKKGCLPCILPNTMSMHGKITDPKKHKKMAA